MSGSRQEFRVGSAMKIINQPTFTTMTAVVAALLFQTPITQAADQGKAGDEDHGAAKITFTKYVTSVPNQPGLISAMTGVGEGDAGDVLFDGHTLKQSPLPPAGVVAVYNLTGTKHSLTALIHGFQAIPGIGQKGVIVGVVISGWLKGHALEGEWTVIPPSYPAGTGVGNSFAVTLKIKKGVND
jgi:hypothetical protein